MFQRNAHTRRAKPHGPDAATLIAAHQARTFAYLATVDRRPAGDDTPTERLHLPELQVLPTNPTLIPGYRPALWLVSAR